jgi:signal transduction histidine kinase
VSRQAPRLSPLAWGALAAAAVAAALGAEAIGGPELPDRAGDLAAGLALMAGGAVAWARRPRAGAGPLMLASGVTWFAGDIWSALLFAHRGPLVQLVLTYPSGRTSSRVTLLVIAAAYVDGLIPDLARSEWATLALMAVVLLVAATHRRSVGGVERRARTAGLAAAALLALTLGLTAVGRLLDAGTDTASIWALYAAVTAIACGLTADLLWGRWTRAALTGFVIDLGDHHEPQALRAALARALGDPSLELAYRLDDRDGWVDEAGRPVALPDAARDGDGDARRAVTSIGEAGAPIAALVHDPATLADPELVASVAAAARLAVANVRLQAEIAGRLEDMAASRLRLMEAGDEERRRLGERLAGGSEARLAEVAARLERLAADSDGEAGALLRVLTDEVATSRAQLRDLAHGIRPRTLTAGGLRPALDELAGQSNVPVEIEVPDERFAPSLELVAYFVCSEALANVAKHADAARVRMAVDPSDGELRIIVEDDGIGGADPLDGAGLRGLADRVEALGGRLRVASPPGAGTRVEAVLPRAGSAGR